MMQLKVFLCMLLIPSHILCAAADRETKRLTLEEAQSLYHQAERKVQPTRNFSKHIKNVMKKAHIVIDCPDKDCKYKAPAIKNLLFPYSIVNKRTLLGADNYAHIVGLG